MTNDVDIAYAEGWKAATVWTGDFPPKNPYDGRSKAGKEWKRGYESCMDRESRDAHFASL